MNRGRNNKRNGVCSFCKREFSDSPAEGVKVKGSYYHIEARIGKNGEYYLPLYPFNGYVCEMHLKEVNWKKIRFIKEKPEFPYGEFDNGNHWRER